MYVRYLTETIIESLNDSPIVLINGARQVGKSTLCKNLITSSPLDSEYLTLDDPVVLEASKADPMSFLIDLPDNFVIDEIQRSPELLLPLKKLVDEDRAKRRVILSGSANVLALPKLADSLAGRMEILHLWPLSSDELNNQRSNFLDVLFSLELKFQSTAEDWRELATRLRIGGYPESLRRTTKSRVRWFNSYLESILQKDIKELSNISGITEIPQILKMIALRVSSTLNLSSISAGVGVSSSSLKRYLSLLNNIFLLVSIPAWTTNVEGRIVKAPKIYLGDTGLLSFLMGDLDDDNLYSERRTAGAALENFVIMEVVKQASWHPKPISLSHFSIHQGTEVDLVIEQGPRRLYGIEVKTSASITAKHFKGLHKLKELAPDRFQKGIVLYTGDKAVSFAPDMQAVPISAIWNS